MTTVERREAQRPSLRARAAYAKLRGGLDRKSSPKVPRKHLGASRRSIVLASREERSLREPDKPGARVKTRTH